MNDMVANNLALVQSDPALMNALQLRATDFLFFAAIWTKLRLLCLKTPVARYYVGLGANRQRRACAGAWTAF